LAGSIRSQAQVSPEADFPPGGGELGRLIRGHDWSRTSLGPVATWPPSLRTAVNIVLQSPLPMVMLWGPDGVMIYNDAYSGFAGRRHPSLLGSKVLEGWTEIADFNARVLQVGLSGGAVSFRDQELTLHRNGKPEQVWMDLHYGPILGDDGRPAGVLATVIETTERVLAARRQAFVYALGERIRESNDPVEIVTTSARMVGEHLRADRVHWAEIDEAAGLFTVQRDWTAGDLPSVVGRHRLDDFGPELLAALRAGQLVAIDDFDSDPMTAGAVAEAFPALKAAIVAPLVRDGRWRAALCVHSRTPRPWGDEELDLVREVAGRTWAAIRRAAAESRVRESEARFRALVNATSEAIYRVNSDWSELRQLEGRGFLADTAGPQPAHMDRYLFPEDVPLVLEAVQEAVAEKKPFQLEHRVRRVDGSEGWIFSRAVPVFGPDGEIVEWFGAASDITARKEAEGHLSLVINELNHRVKNNLAMTQAIAAQTFRNCEDAERAQADFEARIMALAQANDLLTGERWVGASLRGVVEQALQAHARPDGRRLAVEGPEVELTPKTALSLSLALHELATNAVKYGAWSIPEGRVTVEWTTRSADDGPRLHLEWRESGGPRVEPPRRRGFGSRLIERGLAAEMGGTVQLQFHPEGLACVVDAPLRPEFRR
jgi:two-component sensor histidine kinase/GAF domain-containing protein